MIVSVLVAYKNIFCVKVEFKQIKFKLHMYITLQIYDGCEEGLI